MGARALRARAWTYVLPRMPKRAPSIKPVNLSPRTIAPRRATAAYDFA